MTALDAQGTAVGAVVTDSDGHFTLPALPAPGEYRLCVLRIGYRSAMTQSISLTVSLVARVEIRLLANPVPLDTLTVVAQEARVERQLQYLVDAGFYDRRRKGFGYFLTETDIEKHSPIRMTDVLGELAGVRVIRGDVQMPGATTMFIRGSCQATIVLDGYVLRVGGIGGRGSLPLDELLNPANIEAIEVYPSPAGVPVQYSGYMSPCGAIIAWSRR